jgi:hypothetical protein
MTQNCARPADQHGRVASIDWVKALVTDGIDTWVDTVQTCRADAVCDRVRAKAEVEQLPARDVAVLPGRQLGDM